MHTLCVFCFSWSKYVYEYRSSAVCNSTCEESTPHGRHHHPLSLAADHQVCVRVLFVCYSGNGEQQRRRRLGPGKTGFISRLSL